MNSVDFNNYDFKDVPIVEPVIQVKLDEEYQGAWNVAADLDNDGQAEFISARIKDEDDIHSTASVVVTKLDGSILWKWGNPKDGVAAVHSDVACQAYDWDNDGNLEVVVVTESHVISLNGQNGTEKKRFPIPKYASDCIFFADLSGAKEKDIIIKDRYWNVYAYNSSGEQLWHIRRPAGSKTCHHPQVFDLDTSGSNKGVVIGFACYSVKGELIWDLAGEMDELILDGHLDCARIMNLGNTPDETEILMTMCSGRAMVCVSGSGKYKWIKTGLHYESADVGKVIEGDSKQIIVDIDHCFDMVSPLQVYSESGDKLLEVITTRSRQHILMKWDRNDIDRIVIAEGRVVIDGQTGRPVCRLSLPMPDNVHFESAEGHMTFGGHVLKCLAADIDGDGIQELVVFTNPGAVIWIFKPSDRIKPRDYNIGTEDNFTFY